MNEEQRRAEVLDRAAEDWVTANGRYADTRVNNHVHRAFVAGYHHAQDDVIELRLEIREMEAGFRAAMQEVTDQHRQQLREAAEELRAMEQVVFQAERDRERSNWL